MDLNELADLVEALAGPDREVDVAIFKMKGAPVPFQFANKIVALSYDESERCYFAPLGDMRVRYEPPAYTASIDAAMTLVPKNMKASILLSAIQRALAKADFLTALPVEISAAALRTKALGAVHTLTEGN